MVFVNFTQKWTRAEIYFSGVRILLYHAFMLLPNCKVHNPLHSRFIHVTACIIAVGVFTGEEWRGGQLRANDAL